MKLTTAMFSICLIGFASHATAEGVAQNPAVKARIETMEGMKANVGLLGAMAAGKADFDAAKAAEAAAALSAAAATVPDLFAANETDPVSEAKPEIWANMDDFKAKSEALFKAASAVDATSLDGVKAGMGAVGGSCKACHEAYRL